jgi:hypothetical protein
VKTKDVVDVIRNTPRATYSAALKALMGSHHVSRKTAQRALVQALGSGSVYKTNDGFYEVLQGK